MTTQLTTRDDLGDLSAATPAQIDTILQRLAHDEAVAESYCEAAGQRVHRAANDRQERVRAGRVTIRRWSLSLAAAQAQAHLVADNTALPHSQRAAARKALDDLTSTRAVRDRVREEAAPLEAEYARRRWTRAFLVQNAGGHVHRDMRCSTCNRGNVRTEFAWMVDYSGKDETEIVEAAGQRACTVCYPSAPVEILARPTRMFGPDELAAELARRQRAEEKATREAARAAKAITNPDGSPLLDQHRFRIATVATAWQDVVALVLNHRAWGYDEHTAVRDAIITALAAKLDQTETAVWTQLETKVAAKAKRDGITLPAAGNRTEASMTAEQTVWTLTATGTYLMDIAVSADPAEIGRGVARALDAIANPLSTHVAGYLVTGQPVPSLCQPSDLIGSGTDTQSCTYCSWSLRLPDPQRHALVLAHVAH